MKNIFCYRSGQIIIRDEGLPQPKGTLPIRLKATPEEVQRVEGLSRLAYDNKTLLVPGLPEAEDDEKAYAAFDKFVDRLNFAANHEINRRVRRLKRDAP